MSHILTYVDYFFFVSDNFLSCNICRCMSHMSIYVAYVDVCRICRCMLSTDSASYATYVYVCCSRPVLFFYFSSFDSFMFFYNIDQHRQQSCAGNVGNSDFVFATPGWRSWHGTSEASVVTRHPGVANTKSLFPTFSCAEHEHMRYPNEIWRETTALPPGVNSEPSTDFLWSSSVVF